MIFSKLIFNRFGTKTWSCFEKTHLSRHFKKLVSKSLKIDLKLNVFSLILRIANIKNPEVWGNVKLDVKEATKLYQQIMFEPTRKTCENPNSVLNRYFPKYIKILAHQNNYLHVEKQVYFS